MSRCLFTFGVGGRKGARVHELPLWDRQSFAQAPISGRFLRGRGRMPPSHPEAAWSGGRGWGPGVTHGRAALDPAGAAGGLGLVQGGGGRGGRRGAHAAEGVGHLLVQVSAFHPPLHPAAPSGHTARAPRGGRDLGAGGLRSHTVWGRQRGGDG